MNIKQSLFFTIIFSLFVSLVLTFFMTAIFVGFNEHFGNEYQTGLIISIVVSMVMSFIFSPILQKLILDNKQPSTLRMIIFDALLAIILAAGVTFAILFFGNGYFQGFIATWMRMWMVASGLCFFITSATSQHFQQLTLKLIK